MLVEEAFEESAISLITAATVSLGFPSGTPSNINFKNPEPDLGEQAAMVMIRERIKQATKQFLLLHFVIHGLFALRLNIFTINTF
jgi:hypothetical protein